MHVEIQKDLTLVTANIYSAHVVNMYITYLYLASFKFQIVTVLLKQFISKTFFSR